MLLASSYNYPALDIFWTIIEIILWVIWIWILIYIFIDIFRSRDLSGWAKALWFLFLGAGPGDSLDDPFRESSASLNRE